VGRLLFQVFEPGREGHALGLLMVVGVISVVRGAALALAQDDLKRLLAFDTVSQMGLLAVALASGSIEGVTGAAYHLVNHALVKSLLFLCAAAVIHTTGDRACPGWRPPAPQARRHVGVRPRCGGNRRDPAARPALATRPLRLLEPGGRLTWPPRASIPGPVHGLAQQLRTGRCHALYAVDAVRVGECFLSG